MQSSCAARWLSGDEWAGLALWYSHILTDRRRREWTIDRRQKKRDRKTHTSKKIIKSNSSAKCTQSITSKSSQSAETVSLCDMHSDRQPNQPPQQLCLSPYKYVCSKGSGMVCLCGDISFKWNLCKSPAHSLFFLHSFWFRANASTDELVRHNRPVFPTHAHKCTSNCRHSARTGPFFPHRPLHPRTLAVNRGVRVGDRKECGGVRGVRLKKVMVRATGQRGTVCPLSPCERDSGVSVFGLAGAPPSLSLSLTFSLSVPGAASH